VLPHIGDLPIAEVRARHLIDVFHKLRTDPNLSLAPRSIYNIYSVVSAVFRDAKLADLIEQSPCVLDERHLGPLIDNRIKATIFATRRWLDSNVAVIKLLKANADLFQVQNHGAQHLPAIIGTEKAYGLAPAGTANAIFAEVLGGEQAVTAAFGIRPTWYRDATALYTHDAMGVVTSMNQKIAGFSLNGDIGASVSAETAKMRISAAKEGDVIISHINQPKREAGAGVIEGVLALKTRGFDFVHLDDVQIVAAA